MGEYINFSHFLLDLSPQFGQERNGREQIIGAERRKGMDTNQALDGKI